MADHGNDNELAVPAPAGAGGHGTELRWGCGGVPLLPRWHRQAFAGCDTPAEARAETSADTLDRTAAGWAAAGSRIADRPLAALADAVDGFPPPPQTVVANDRAVLLALPLRARTRASLGRLGGGGAVTVASLLALPRFGTFALLDVMCAAEAAETAAAAAGGPAGLPEVRRRVARAADALDGLLDAADSVDRVAAEHRLAAAPPASLATAAGVAGCSRETVRRRERRLRAVASDAAGDAPQTAAGWIRHRLGAAAASCDVDEAVASCAARVPDGQSRRIVEGLIRGASGYRPVSAAAMMVTAEGVAAVAEISAAANRLSDDVGLVARAALAAEFADRAWAGSFDGLCAAAGLAGRGTLLSEAWTASAAVKAALIERGSPADAATLACDAGISTVRASVALSRIPSTARADKSRWGLKQWRCGEYRGIAAEMAARIGTLGGEADMADLAAELSELYGVARDSVWAIAHTPQFELDPVNRTVAVARNPTVSLGDLDDVVSGRTGGDPHWRFRVTAAHLRGVSIASVPGEVVAALGCGVGGRTTAEVRNPAGCGPVSVIWRAASVTGPEIGRAGRALAALGCEAGRHARVVIHPDGAVSFAQDNTTAATGG